MGEVMKKMGREYRRGVVRCNRKNSARGSCLLGFNTTKQLVGLFSNGIRTVGRLKDELVLSRFIKVR